MPDEARQPDPAETKAFADQFFGILKEKRGVEISCPACDGDAWYAFGDVGIPILEGRNPATGEVEGIPGSVHAIGASCARCGFISLFDRDVIGD